MKVISIFVIFIWVFVNPFWLKGQKIEQSGTVLKINSGGKTISGVQLLFIGATPTVSDNMGRFTLSFDNKNFGDRILMESVIKKGYEVVNIQELREARLGRHEMTILLCPAGELDSMKAVYYNISINTIIREYENNERKLEKLYSEQQISKDEFLAQIKELTVQKDKLTNYAEELAERFARTNFDDVSALYMQAFTLFKSGDIDSAIVVLEKEDLVARAYNRMKERSTINEQMAYVENWRQESDSIKKEDLKTAKVAISSYCADKQYEKADSLFKYVLMSDTTDLKLMIEYTNFLIMRNEKTRAQMYFYKLLNSKQVPDSILVSISQKFHQHPK